MSLDRVELELIVEVVADGAGPGADFDPVVALAADRLLGGLAAVDEVVADAAEGLVETMSAPRTMKSLPSSATTRSTPWPALTASWPRPVA